MKTTDHLTHAHTPVQYAWDTLHWAVHTWAPAWLYSAGLDTAASKLEGQPPIWDLQSWIESQIQLALASQAADKLWQAWLTPFYKELLRRGMATKHWEPVGMPVWKAVEESIRASGWWRILQGCLKDPAGNIDMDNVLVPIEIIIPTNQGDLWSIARDIGRRHAWGACASQITEVALSPVVTPDMQQMLYHSASVALSAIVPKNLTRKLA